eukprot:CAMPEP_0194044632 /NCGR_PEP_ID=MMETSP0009_2-20130614/16075_1 /TAXON_ID=210454 /ORGANISM="Grammatophora oceanica, Strain CCMP 410" /LENGTH=71 /DNA_ID=CAMNT_0038689205 /DNA_START=65 /DNA_END=280 /DNA_ORIENTATION=-
MLVTSLSLSALLDVFVLTLDAAEEARCILTSADGKLSSGEGTALLEYKGLQDFFFDKLAMSSRAVNETEGA